MSTLARLFASYGQRCVEYRRFVIEGYSHKRCFRVEQSEDEVVAS